MKLSFSTLGCPQWDLDTAIQRAGDMGFDGLEIRGIKDQLDVTRLPAFTTEAGVTRRKLAGAGVELICFSTSVRLSEPDLSKRKSQLEELARYSGLCENFGTPFIRIFGGEVRERTWDQAITEAVETLAAMIPITKKSGARIIIETHDDWLSAVHFRILMETLRSDDVGILWDINHPFMFRGEDPVVTWENAGRWIYHIHWKDAEASLDGALDFRPCLMGQGQLPHRTIYALLKTGGYGGYLSLEWEKRWHPELPDPDVAFPQFISYMKILMH